MPTHFDFAATTTTGKAKAGHALALFVTDTLKFVPAAAAIDKATGGHISRALAASSFKGKAGEILSLPGVSGLSADRVVVVGVGAEKDLSPKSLAEAGGNALAALNAARASAAEAVIDGIGGKKIKDAEAAAHLLFGAQMRAYRFDKYRTKETPEKKPSLTQFKAVTRAIDAARKAAAPLVSLAESIHYTRNLVSEPANILHPESYAAECKKLTKLGLKVTVLGVKEMTALGMGALLGVGQGSVRESQLVVLEWNGGKKGEKPVALIGKGVCFDTGGISIKPSGGMEEMKWDMAGSAAVVGTLRALAARKAKANVVGVIGLVENMPDGNAQRPGDVVKTMSGQTVEVLNTDAEGRLVLADALWYCQSKYKPKVMVDLATLTGAIITSLGSHRAGVFTPNDTLADALYKAGEDTGERVWRLPMGPEYDEMINCDIADMKNISDGREAGSVTAAQFLARFTNNVPWAHLDIAGVAWTKKSGGITPKGATGWGVRLLERWIAEHYEK